MATMNYENSLLVKKMQTIKLETRDVCSDLNITERLLDMSYMMKQTDSKSLQRSPFGIAQNKGEAVYVEIGPNQANQEKKTTEEPVKIYCIDLSHLSRTNQFLLLCFTTFFFFLAYGYLQELIFQLEEFRQHGWFLTLIQFGCYVFFELIGMLFARDRVRKIPLAMYVFLAILTVATMGLSNSSVGYLNYPTQVIFKCCKLIPVMIGGVLIQGKKYNCLDVSAMLMMVFGLIFFTLADNSVSPSFNPYGVFLISLALCADGVIGNYQEKALKQYGGSTSEMILYSYAIGFVYILIGILTFGEFSAGLAVCQKYPVKTFGYAVMFSMCGYAGLYIVLTLVRQFGALIAVTVTTCRKAVTIMLSFLFFAKPFTYQYVWSGLVVVLGIYLNVYSKNKAAWDMALSAYWQKIQQKLLNKQKYPAADFVV